MVHNTALQNLIKTRTATLSQNPLKLPSISNRGEN
nr:MAG TPA: hypothetical protein [Caudoviricetes sp.]